MDPVVVCPLYFRSCRVFHPEGVRNQTVHDAEGQDATDACLDPYGQLSETPSQEDCDEQQRWCGKATSPQDGARNKSKKGVIVNIHRWRRWMSRLDDHAAPECGKAKSSCG